MVVEADEGTSGGDEDDVVTDFGERRDRGVSSVKREKRKSKERINLKTEGYLVFLTTQIFLNSVEI